MIAVTCASCRKKLSIKDELAGKRVKCPGCGNPIAVPAVAGATMAVRAKPGSAELSHDGNAPPKTSGAVQEHTVTPDKSAASGQESRCEAAGETADWAGGSPASRPPEGPNPEFLEFLAPAEKADEIGRLGPYRVLKVLGAGGMGVVFRAQDPHLERVVALKAMLPALASTPSAKQRFFREAKAAAALKHPNIVTIFQVGEDRGAPFLAMEFLEGEPLDAHLKRERKPALAEVMRIGREIADGLAAAHEKGLIHRDIKPANIWLEGSKRRVKILDFGLARTLADEAHLTQSGAIVGTPAFMAPEQAEGSPVDHRCDLFSLGCVLYRMCTGEMPFKGKGTLAILSALAQHDPTPPSTLDADIPAELSDLVMKLLAKKPENRPASAQEVGEELRAMMETHAQAPPSSTTKRRPSTGEPTVAWSRPKARRRWLLPVAAGGVLLTIGVAALIVFRRPDAPVTDPAEAGSPNAGLVPPFNEEGAGVKINVEKDHIDFLAGTELVGRYQIGKDRPRPIFWPLLAPGGVRVTRSWPMEKITPSESTDHPHHQSAWFGHGEVIPESIEIKDKVRGSEGVNFWSLAKGHGWIVCTNVAKPAVNGVKGHLTTLNEWRTSDGIKILDETRRIFFYNFARARLFVLDIDLAASVCPITFGDTKEGTMGIRINDEIAEENQSGGKTARGQGTIENAEGRLREKGCWGQLSAWCDYSGPIGGKTVGLALLTDPNNPYPSCWHSRASGLMAANPFGRSKAAFPATEAWTDIVRLGKGQHLRLRYGILIHEGNAETGQVANHYQQFASFRTAENTRKNP